MSDLKPCPFCGGEAEFGYRRSGSFVNCVECLASTNQLVDLGMTENEAIAAWNTRATPVVTDAMVEAALNLVNSLTHDDKTRDEDVMRAVLTAALAQLK